MIKTSPGIDFLGELTLFEDYLSFGQRWAGFDGMPVNLFNMAWQKGRMNENHTQGRYLDEHAQYAYRDLPVAAVGSCGDGERNF